MVVLIRDLLIKIGWTLMPIYLELEIFVTYTTESESVVNPLSHYNLAVGAL